MQTANNMIRQNSRLTFLKYFGVKSFCNISRQQSKSTTFARRPECCCHSLTRLLASTIQKASDPRARRCSIELAIGGRRSSEQCARSCGCDTKVRRYSQLVSCVKKRRSAGKQNNSIVCAHARAPSDAMRRQQVARARARARARLRVAYFDERRQARDTENLLKMQTITK